MSSIGTKLDGNQVLKQAYDEPNNRLRVDAAVSASISDIVIEDPDGDILGINADGSIDVNVINSIQVEIDAADGDNIAISDGTDTLDVNPDGSLNVHTIFDGDISSSYNEVTSVASSVPTTLVTYTAGISGKLKLVDVAGTNIAMYELLLNATVIDKRYTYFGNSLNATFEFGDGLSLSIADTLLVRVTHLRPMLGDFNGRIQVLEGV